MLENMNTGIRIDNGGLINWLLYADDIALLAKNRQDAQRLADQAKQWADSYKLQINPTKTEYLVKGTERSDAIRLAGAEVAPQTDIKYLGFQMHRSDQTAHPRARLEKAKIAMYNLSRTFSQVPDIQAMHKLRAAQAWVDAVYLYGLEITSGRKL